MKKILGAVLLAAFVLPAASHDGRDAKKKVERAEALLLTNGRIHTMDAQKRVVDEVLIENGRFVDVGRKVDRSGRVKVIDLRGRTVIPGIIDAHNHIVLVGNRPGRHTGMEHVFTIPEAIQAYLERSVEDDRKGDLHVLSNKQMGYAYRHSSAPKDLIFTSAVFEGVPEDREAIKAAMDAVQQANSGHPGMAMGMAESMKRPTAARDSASGTAASRSSPGSAPARSGC